MGAYLARLITCTLAIIAISAAAVFGQETVTAPTTDQIVLPIGEWIAFAVDVILGGVAIIVTWLFRQIPGQLGAMLMTARADQALTKAIEFGLTSVKDASKDKQLTIETANKVALTAYRYFSEHGNDLIVRFAGTRQQIIEKIWARLNVAPEAEVVNTTGTPKAI